MKILSVLLIFINLGFTFYFIGEGKPSSLGSYVFWIGYLSLPYLVMGYFILKEKIYPAGFLGVIVVCLLTLYSYFDVFYIHPDPQAMLFIFMLPMLQGGVFFIWWVIRKILKEI